VANTLFAASIVTTQGLVPVVQTPPLQPVNSDPVDAVGESVTAVPDVKGAWHVPALQVMPAGDEVTVPEPAPSIETVRP
jgi:hypothetical protein